MRHFRQAIGAGLCGLACLLVALPAFADKAARRNPVAYCKEVGTIDVPDGRYQGPAVPEWMVAKAYPPEAIKAQKAAGMDPANTIVWRCAGGAVLMCVQGNSAICGKADQSKVPTKAMRDFCAETPNAEVIPLSVIGHENPMIYEWSCKGKEPTLGRQIFKVDAEGYPAELWEKVFP